MITYHHRLAQSWGGNSLPNNLVNLRENVHRALHTLLDDKTPIQQQRHLLELNKGALHPDCYLEISKVLARFEKIEINCYDPRLFDSDKFLKRQKR